MEDKDHCSFFPEHWLTWEGKYIYIGWMCKGHDNEPKEGEEFKGCANTQFFKDTHKANLIGATPIAIIASIVCFFKFPKKQIKRV